VKNLKSLIFASSGALLLAGLCAFALDDIPLPTNIYDGDAVMRRVEAIEGGSQLGSGRGPASATYSRSPITETVITISGLSLVAADAADRGVSSNIFTAVEGSFALLGAVLNATVVSSVGATNELFLGVGTGAQNATNPTPYGVNIDIIPKITLDCTSAGFSTNTAAAILAAPAIFDGTAAAKSLYFNLGIKDDDMSAGVTNVVNGTLTLLTTKLLDK